MSEHDPIDSIAGRRRRRLQSDNGDSAIRRRAPAHGPAWHERGRTSRALHRLGELTGHADVGVFVTLLLCGWVVVGGLVAFPTWWQTVLYSTTASTTFVMVFVIQHTQARQVSAIQRKLDELVRVSDDADDALISVEQAPDETLQALADLNVADNANATTTS